MKRKTISLLISLIFFTTSSLSANAASVQPSSHEATATIPSEQEETSDEDESIEESAEDSPQTEDEQGEEKDSTPSDDQQDTTEEPASEEVTNPDTSPIEEESEESTEESSEGEIPEVESPDAEHNVLSYEIELHPGEHYAPEKIHEYLAEENYEVQELVSPLEKTLVTEEHIGQHVITATVTNSEGEEIICEIVIIISGVPVIITEPLTLEEGTVFDFSKLPIRAEDYEDGDISETITLVDANIEQGEVIDASKTPVIELIIEATDNDDNKTVSEVEITTVGIEPYASISNPLEASGHKIIAGSNRFKTASAISQEMYQSADTVILVSSNNFPDALAAGPLSVSLSAPILLTDKDSLSVDTLAEIKRLGAEKVFIMGGELAISSEVARELNSENLLTERISGSNRYKTAIAAAKTLGSSTSIILTNGENFADALTAGSYAAKNKLPIILTKSDTIPAEVLTYIDDSITEIIVMGGELAIKEASLVPLKNPGRTITRIAGGNRYVTGIEMASKYFSDAQTAIVASGTNFVDALSAVPYAAALDSPIMITAPDDVDERVLDFMMQSTIKNYHFIGGDLAISPAVKDLIMNPSLYSIVYRSSALSENWAQYTKNGKTTGDLNNDGLSLFEISLEGEKDLYIRYGVSTQVKGWQNIAESGSVGNTSEYINGLIMEIKGSDAASYDVSYRAYIKDSGWSEWVNGGRPVGSDKGKAIQAIEAKIISGNALNIDQTLFPDRPKQKVYSYTSTTTNLRTGPSSSAPVLMSLPGKSHIEVITNSGASTYSQVKYTARNVNYSGYVYTNHLRSETHTTNTVLTVDNLSNGMNLPTKTTTVTGDIAYKNGIKEIRYYINGADRGAVDHGYTTTTSLAHGFSVPSQTGYKLTIPSSSWKKGAVNTLRIEMTGSDGKSEWETIYFNDTNDMVEYRNYSGSFNYYVTTEYNKGSALYYNYSWKPAPMEQISTYMDPTYMMTHVIYKYLFLDLGYSASDYTVTAEQLDDIIEGKGVLDGMGHVFLKAAVDFNINPFYLVSHAILETGHGTSALATGNKLEYYHSAFGAENSELIPLSPEDQSKKWYNMFGIGAYDSNPLLWGTEKAYHEGWDSVEKAIYGGAEWIASGYIDRKPESQNTNYMMRYNLKETMSHQYATDIMWAYKQASRIKAQFDEIDTDIPLKFIVPVFGDVRP